MMSLHSTGQFDRRGRGDVIRSVWVSDGMLSVGTASS